MYKKIIKVSYDIISHYHTLILVIVYGIVVSVIFLHFFSYGLNTYPELHFIHSDFSKSKYGLVDGQSIHLLLTMS